MRKPNFFIIGAPKSGTTALYTYLREHPRVFLPRTKEPHFFATDLNGPYFVRDETEYLTLFSSAGSDAAAIGEGSVWYLLSRAAPEALRAFAPQARLIALVRDPTDMYSSLHNQMLTSLYEDVVDPARAWELQTERRRGRLTPPLCSEPAFLQYRDVCSVGDQLLRWLDVFPREQLHCILFDDLARHTARVYGDTLEFLGLPDDGRTEFARINEAHAPLSRRLQELHHRADRRLVGHSRRRLFLPLLAPLRPISRALRRINYRRVSIPPLEPEFEGHLRQVFEPQVRILERILDRELSGWTLPPTPAQAVEPPPGL